MKHSFAAGLILTALIIMTVSCSPGGSTACAYDTVFYRPEYASGFEIAGNKGKASRNDTRFVRTEHFKLYHDGRFFNTEEDPMEQTPVVPCSETEKQAFGMLDSVLKSFPSWKPGDLPEVRKTGDYKAASVEPKPKK